MKEDYIGTIFRDDLYLIGCGTRFDFTLYATILLCHLGKQDRTNWAAETKMKMPSKEELMKRMQLDDPKDRKMTQKGKPCSKCGRNSRCSKIYKGLCSKLRK